jgi:serine/threonine-protein kinase
MESFRSDPAGSQKDWKRVEELYHQALSKARSERAQFLESACQGNPELRREVESLLASLEKDGALFDAPALEVAARILAKSPQSTLHPGTEPSHTTDSGETGTTHVGTLLEITRKVIHHAPWWLYLLAAVFLADGLLRTYCIAFGPRGFDFALRRQGGRPLVAAVPHGSAAETAGFKPGDILIALDGHALRRPSDWRTINSNLAIGRIYCFEIERDTQRVRVAYSMARVRISESGELVLWQIIGLFLLATAFFIAFSRPHDGLARTGALALAALSCFNFWPDPPPGYAVIWRNLPFAMGALLWVPIVCSYLVGPMLLTFFARFPSSLLRARWPWVIVWLPALCLVPAFFHDAFLMVYRPQQAYGNILPVEIRSAGVRLFGVYGLVSVAALALNYFRLTDLNERRRLRVLFIGGAAAVLPGAVRLLIWQAAPLSGIFRWLMSGVPSLVVAFSFFLFPVCFAYAILRHHLLDIRVMIRQGIQYAATRGALFSLVPLLGLILIADLLAHGDQPLLKILEARGWVYAAIAIVAVGAHSQRRRWTAAIDRQFFREQYDSLRLLREVSEEAGRVRSFSHATQRIVTRIETALHPEFAAIMQRAPCDSSFSVLSSCPPDKAPPEIVAGSSLISRLRMLGDPLETSLGASNWLRRQLPDEEIEFVRRARIDLLVPISMSPDHKEALIALGAKRSEEPYTREDKRLLEAIAVSLALPFEKEALAARYSSGTFDECPQCGACSDSGTRQCTVDGAALTPVPLSRTLAGRYLLERRRGRGGMGTVYEAKDTSLGRRVAVKVIREEFVHSAAAAQRFQREARAAAVFGHPNVVTVHDYGVEAGTRAFLVMELLEGGTLRDELRCCGPIAANRALEIFHPICDAVNEAHLHQLVHRDLKPENIFLARNIVTGTETVKVLDFGVAKFLEASEDVQRSEGYAVTESGVLIGTPGYMSPEQLLGENPAVSWDIWALAVVLYETLTGALPFPLTEGSNWRQLVLAGRYTPLGEHLADPLASWQDFFARCLATRSTVRPLSAAEFFRQLEQALAHVC